MGITARGAWESVKQHLRRLGRGPDDAITVVGIGDMSGDVFGNGMLLSPHIELVGAFDHRHVMLDPTPNAAKSFDERQRLFALPSSSWDEFDRTVISTGGGVWPRSAKSIPVSPEACAALGIDRRQPVVMSPTELIHHILQAPVDLLWNGGIGTYVKSSDEVHSAAGDRTNDTLRVDADELRCRIVGEGGNLGLTQRARIEFARRGGLINTDAIDNSAGVDTSDHEVNIKILLDGAVIAGALPGHERNGVLATMTDEVAALVLADNIDQNQALVNAVTLAPAMLETHGRYLTHLEHTARLDRALEALPDTDALMERKAQGAGLTAPELAVVLAYTKLSLSEQFLAEGFDEASMHDVLHAYFPSVLRTKFADAIDTHPLRREIIATCVVNKVVNRNGVTFVFRLQEETHASVGDVLRAHSAACALIDADTLWHSVRSQADGAETTIVAMLLEVDRVVERVSRWLLQHCRLPLDMAQTIAAYGEGVATVAKQLDSLYSDAERTTVEARATRWTETGASTELAARVAALDLLPAALDVTTLATGRATDVGTVARVYFALDEQLGLGTLRERIVALPRNDRWDALARSALRDDLAGEHRALTAAVLATPDSEDHVHAWSVRNEPAIRQHLATLRDVEDGGQSTIASLSVVLRGLRSLAVTL
jgi:glutamate dehydrogenase